MFLMKRCIALVFVLFYHFALQAQPWMPPNPSGPIKLNDVIQQYKQNPYPASQDEAEHNATEGKERKESADHLFERWLWYMRLHCDKDGFIVNPGRNFTEWENYKAQHTPGALAKPTCVPSNWIFQGPHQSQGGYSGMGRINVIAFDPLDSNTFYVGSAAGSTWKTNDGGITWASMYDNLATLGVSDIKINPHNTRTIYIATGDGDAGDAFSSGVIKSYDKGLTWHTTGLNWMASAYMNARSLLLNPVDTNSLILATNAGLYKTHNGGANWNQVAVGNFKQILYCPGDTTLLYASVYINSTAQILRSPNAGITWDTISNFPSSQRVCLAVTAANANVVRALVSNNSSGLQGVYNSTNKGLTFTSVFIDTNCTNNLLGYDNQLPTGACGGQGWYDLCMAIDPTNADITITGGVNLAYSADAGNTWAMNTAWYQFQTMPTVHADKHFLGFNSLNHALYVGCDGGIYRSYTPQTGPYSDLSNGIGITEFYKNAVDNNVSFCIGGAQDNGTKMVEGGLAYDLTGGDGMQCHINYGDPAHIWYCSFPGGAIDMTSDSGSNYHSITDTIHNSGDWVAPYSIHPSDTQTLFLAYKCVYESNNNGLSWNAISPVFDTNYNIQQMAIANSNPNYIYLAYCDYSVWKSVMYHTINGGATWDTITVPFTSFISDIKVDPKNENLLWVAVSGYNAGDKVYCYDLAHHNWINKSSSLPNLPVECILIDSAFGTKYIGTDAAIYYQDSNGSTWALFNTHLPTVHVSDLNINYTTQEIWAATFGRGMWKSLKKDQIAPTSVQNLQIAEDAIGIYPDPNDGDFILFTTDKHLMGKTVTIALLNTQGQNVFTQQGTFDANGKMHIVNKSLKPGNYVCSISYNNIVSKTRVIIK